jgi:peptidoglycan/LPS O-acetylase OafA/YrhL
MKQRSISVTTRSIPSQTPRMVFLDYLRVFAFASVLIGHKFAQPLEAAISEPTSLWHWPAQILWPWVRAGGAGVLVFFLVSGYIITYVLERENCVEFLIRRAARIYPLYMVAVLAEYGMQTSGQRVPVSTLLWQLSLLGNWNDTPYALGTAEWTLRLELMFYLLMAALRGLGLMAWRGGAILPLLYAALVLVLFAVGPWPNHAANGLGYVSLYFPFLLVGAIVQLQERGSVSRLTAVLFVAWVLCCHYLGLVRWQAAWLNAYFPLLALSLFLVLWWGRRLWSGPAWLLWLSELTYAVYLLHNWAFDRLRDGATQLGAGTVMAPALALLALLVVCAALVRAVEQPGIRWGRRIILSLRAGGRSPVTP